jgi:hypothetical protein
MAVRYLSVSFHFQFSIRLNCKVSAALSDSTVPGTAGICEILIPYRVRFPFRP